MGETKVRREARCGNAREARDVHVGKEGVEYT